MTPLPKSFLERPITHRGFHDLSKGRPENSLSAFEAAVAGGYGIELDLQLSSDGEAISFHDYSLGRLTDQTGPLAQRSRAELAGITLTGSDEGIPSLGDVLGAVAGRVPLLIELKDQDGALGPNVGPLEDATLDALNGYAGDVALMSFNPHSVARLAARAGGAYPLGLTTCHFSKQDWPTIPEKRLQELAAIPDFDRVGASFISSGKDSLDRAPVHALKARGVPILSWTIRSEAEAAEARKIADNITFEGYTPA